MPNEFDTVRLIKPISAPGVSVGDIGTIVHVYSSPRVAFEVEFADDDGETIALVPLTPDFLAVDEPYRQAANLLAA